MAKFSNTIMEYGMVLLMLKGLSSYSSLTYDLNVVGILLIEILFLI